MIFRWLKDFPLFRTRSTVAQQKAGLGKSVLVPVAKDDSFLNHGCVRAKGVQIGPKGDEVYVATLEEALEVLGAEREVGEPVKWRRPNEHGHFGIVVAVGWEERPYKDVFGVDEPVV